MTSLSAVPPFDVKSSLTSQTTIVWLLVLLALPLSRLASSSFPSWSLVEGTLVLSLFLVLVSFGQGLVILTGGIDLSLASAVALGAYLTGRLASDGTPVVVAVALALLACAVVGAISGLLVGSAGFPPFIVTLAIGAIVAAALLGFSQGAPAQQAPAALAAWFRRDSELLGLPTPIWLLVVACVLGWLIQHRSRLGRQLFAVGGSPAAAKVSGIGPVRTYAAAYAIAGLSYGLAGIALLGYSSGADLGIGDSWLLPSITAVVVGGSSIRGGSGSFLATVAGAILITLLSTDLNAAGFAEGWKQVLYGVVIVVALLGARLANRAGR